MSNKKVSICIPCYNKTSQVELLLNSIAAQTFKDHEVIITDNSSDNEIEILSAKYDSILDVKYYKNEHNIGAVANWNKAIELSTGEWIKVMHSDDYFSDEHSLQYFVDATKSDQFDLIFSNYTNVNLNTGVRIAARFPLKKTALLLEEPMILNSKNIIGNPSATLIRSAFKHIVYDERFIWKVDFEYYINLLKNKARILNINREIIIVGQDKEQITNSVKHNPRYELPESYFLLEKYGVACLNNSEVYDSFWRSFRNLDIYTLPELRKFADFDWGPVIEHMLSQLNKSNRKLLKYGVYSKLKMFCAFLQRPKV